MFVSLDIFVGALEQFLCINNAAEAPSSLSARLLSKGKQTHFK
jgi:hypothetical protein